MLTAPGKTPAAVVQRLREAVLALYANPAYQAKLDSLGLVAQKITGKELNSFVRDQQQSMIDVAKRANIQPE